MKERKLESMFRGTAPVVGEQAEQLRKEMAEQDARIKTRRIREELLQV